MKVRVYDTDEAGNETLRCECWLDDCFPDRNDDYHAALAELHRAGRVWIGGGAAPLCLLMQAERQH